jgi:hypothetical protein
MVVICDVVLLDTPPIKIWSNYNLIMVIQTSKFETWKGDDKNQSPATFQ